MPPRRDRDLRALIDGGADKMSLFCNVCKTVQTIKCRKGRGDIEDGLRLFCHGAPQLVKEALFELGDPLFCTEHFHFVLFEFRGDEALGMNERLPAVKGRGHFWGLRAAHFDVVAKSLRVAHFQCL